MYKEIISSSIAIMALTSLLFFRRKMRTECKKIYIKPPGYFEFWFVIDDIWRKSKMPGNEKLKATMIKILFSWLIFLICIPFIVI